MTFKITDSPAALPASCLFCPGSIRKWYIDCDYSIEFHGALYICDLCLQEMSHVAGYITPEHAETIKTLNVNLEVENLKLLSRIKALETSLGSLVDVGYSVRDSASSFTDTSMVSSMAESKLPEAASVMGDGEGETSESGDDEGVGELFSDASSESEFTLDF